MRNSSNIRQLRNWFRHFPRLGLVDLHREPHGELGAYPIGALNRDVAAHGLHNALADHEAEACAVSVEALLVLKLAKEFEQFLERLSFDANARVFHDDPEHPHLLGGEVDLVLQSSGRLLGALVFFNDRELPRKMLGSERDGLTALVLLLEVNGNLNFPLSGELEGVA